jgi:hypothetical protein
LRLALFALMIRVGCRVPDRGEPAVSHARGRQLRECFRIDGFASFLWVILGFIFRHPTIGIPTKCVEQVRSRRIPLDKMLRLVAQCHPYRGGLAQGS